MKLLLVIVSKEDANEVEKHLNEENFFNTRLDTKGGFLKENNSTFIIGLKEEKIDQALEIFKKYSKTRTKTISSNIFDQINLFSSSEVTVGGSVVFILDVEKFLKI
ncbi:cyclic-di-AMP receptor ['Camptotheca acuminata' phytoplasma]|uniref:cyclic-di-AMP receptor n=1 Tax='Camptotheca acuminata' phytoplasma TaxID=3239192 RepID=UPI00351A15F5